MRFYWFILFVLLLSLVTGVYGYAETFQVPVGSIFIPIPITRSVELKKGDRLTGSFHFQNLPTVEAYHHYSVGLVIHDPDDNILIVFNNETYGTFNLTASYAGIYKLSFGFTCSDLPVSPSAVTLNYEVESASSLNFPSINLPPETVYVLIGCVTFIIVSYLILKRNRKV